MLTHFFDSVSNSSSNFYKILVSVGSPFAGNHITCFAKVDAIFILGEVSPFISIIHLTNGGKSAVGGNIL